MEVLGPKGPANRFGGTDMERWARHQLRVAYDVVDNPGGGLNSAIQSIGQVKSGLREEGGEQYAALVEVLDRTEDAAVHRHYARVRELLGEALAHLPPV